MDKTTKTILIVIGSFLVLCACVAAIVLGSGLWGFSKFIQFADKSTTEDLAEVARLGSEIAVFTLPDGFGSPYGMHIGEITSVGFASQSKNTHILLTQFPEGTVVNTDKMLKLIKKYTADNRWSESQTTVIEEKPVTIRGEGTTLSISEGTSSDGIQYRSAVATFDGNGGPALVLITGPIDEWDHQMVEDFIASIE